MEKYGTSMPAYFCKFIESTTEAERTTENYIKHINKYREAQIKNGEVIEKVGLKTKAATIAMKSLSFGANMLVSMAISTALQGIVTWLDNTIHRQEKIIEKGKEAKKVVEEINKSYSDKASFTENNMDRYTALREGVDITSNKNNTLSIEEYKEFLDLM